MAPDADASVWSRCCSCSSCSMTRLLPLALLPMLPLLPPRLLLPSELLPPLLLPTPLLLLSLCCWTQNQTEPSLARQARGHSPHHLLSSTNCAVTFVELLARSLRGSRQSCRAAAKTRLHWPSSFFVLVTACRCRPSHHISDACARSKVGSGMPIFCGHWTAHLFWAVQPPDSPVTPHAVPSGAPPPSMHPMVPPNSNLPRTILLWPSSQWSLRVINYSCKCVQRV